MGRARSKSKAKAKVITCRPVALPPELWEDAAATAVGHNPANAPNWESVLAAGKRLVESFRKLLGGEPDLSEVMPPGFIAAITSKYWGAKGVKLSVSFTDGPTSSLRKKIISHMNSWGSRANVVFAETAGQGQVRIARTRGQGYWSYLGTDVLHIPAGQQTMNLEGFADSTPEAEFFRVVRHETGHTLGFPHEHLRSDLVRLLDPKKTIAYFQSHYGWDARTTTEQVLTPISEGSLLRPTPVDALSIMCYQLDGACTRSGEPIPGGADIDETDYAYAATIYPQAVAPPPPPPPPPPPGNEQVLVDVTGRTVRLPSGWKASSS